MGSLLSFEEGSESFLCSIFGISCKNRSSVKQSARLPTAIRTRKQSLARNTHMAFKSAWETRVQKRAQSQIKSTMKSAKKSVNRIPAKLFNTGNILSTLKRSTHKRSTH